MAAPAVPFASVLPAPPPARLTGPAFAGREGVAGFGGLAGNQSARTTADALTAAMAWTGSASGMLSNTCGGLTPSVTVIAKVLALAPFATPTVIAFAAAPEARAEIRSDVFGLAVARSTNATPGSNARSCGRAKFAGGATVFTNCTSTSFDAALMVASAKFERPGVAVRLS